MAQIRMVRLGDICKVVSGTTPKTENPDYWDGNLNWITPAEITDETVVIYESQRKITQAGVKSCGLTPFPAGTVILSSRAPIGKTAIAGVDMYCNQGFKNLICSDLVFNKYLFWFLRSKTDYLNFLGRGATFKEISKKIVEEIEIPLVSMEQQQSVAAILDKVSAVIATRKRQLAKLDELVKARFVEMFGDVQRTQFEVSTIGDECKLKSGTTFPSDKELPVGDYPYIKVSDMNLPKNEVYIKTSYAYVSAETAGSTFMEKGTVIFPKRGGAIGTNKKRILCKDTCADLNIMGVIPGQRMKTEYLYVYFQRLDLNSICNGSTVPQINNKDVAPLQIIVPPLELQECFAAFVRQSEKMRLTIRQGLDTMETLKRALMQEYFG